MWPTQSSGTSVTTIDCMMDAGKPDETPGSFPAWLKHHREQAGITPAQAARKAGLSRARWSHAEAGFEMKQGVKKTVGHEKDTVVRMAHAVGGDVHEALILAGYAAVPREDARIEADLAVLREAIKATLDLDPSKHADLIELIRDLAVKPSPDTVAFLQWGLGLSPDQRRYLIAFAASVSGAKIADDAVSTERVIDTPRDGNIPADGNDRASRS